MVSTDGGVYENYSLWKGLLLKASGRLLTAFAATDRALYVGSYGNGHGAYQDAPLPIGFGATISAPHMHAMAVQLLEAALVPGSRVLDVGCGSGYLTAVLARIVAPREPESPHDNLVVAIDCVEDLVNFARKNVARDSPELASKITWHCGDGWAGYAAAAPFNAIHVGAAAAHIPHKLVEQLALGGLMVIPVGGQGAAQKYFVIRKTTEGVEVRKVADVCFVPLIKGCVTRSFADQL